MPYYKIKRYDLNQNEIDKIESRKRVLSQFKNLHPSQLHQTIDLDKREATLPISITKGENIGSIINYAGKSTFALDIINQEGILISRHFLVPKNNITQNHQYWDFKINDHIYGFMSEPDEKIKIYSIDGLIER